MPTKHVLKSKTIRAGLINALSALALLFVSHNAEDKYFALVMFVTALFTIYGRLVAKHKLYWRKDAKSDN